MLERGNRTVTGARVPKRAPELLHALGGLDGRTDGLDLVASRAVGDHALGEAIDFAHETAHARVEPALGGLELPHRGGSACGYVREATPLEVRLSIDEAVPTRAKGLQHVEGTQRLLTRERGLAQHVSHRVVDGCTIHADEVVHPGGRAQQLGHHREGPSARDAGHRAALARQGDGVRDARRQLRAVGEDGVVEVEQDELDAVGAAGGWSYHRYGSRLCR